MCLIVMMGLFQILEYHFHCELILEVVFDGLCTGAMVVHVELLLGFVFLLKEYPILTVKSVFAEFGQWRRGSRFKDIKKDESKVDDPDGNVARTVASIFYLHYSNIILRL
jgi:hypothetical protein